MVLAASVMHLHIDRRLIGLDVTSGERLAPHRSHHRCQHLAYRPVRCNSMWAGLRIVTIIAIIP